MKMWEPYRNFNYYQNLIAYESFFSIQVDELFWLLYMFFFPDEIEVACLKTIKKDDLIMFFKVHAHTNHMFITLTLIFLEIILKLNPDKIIY